MLVAFANNQAMTAIDGTPSVITTDPVPLSGNDRASAMLGIHYIFGQGGATISLAYKAQLSNDGTNWVDSSTLTDTYGAVTTAPRQKVAAINAAYIRFVYTFTVTGAPDDVGGVCFDLHVNLDHV
jgi:hypothetical protein